MTSIPVSPTSKLKDTTMANYVRPYVSVEAQQLVFLNPPIISNLPPLIHSGSPSKHLASKSLQSASPKLKKSKFPESFFKSREPTPVHAIDYLKVISFLTNKHSTDLYERHVDVLLKLCAVYKDKSIPEPHVTPLGTVFMLIINKVNEGATELLIPLENLVKVCLSQASTLHWSMRFLEDLFIVLLSSKISSECKEAIFNGLHSLALHPHAILLSSSFSTMVEMLSSFSFHIPILQHFLLCCTHPTLKSLLRGYPLSPILRSMLVSQSLSMYIKVLTMDLAWEVIVFDQEDVDMWVPVLSEQMDLHLILELFQFMYTMASMVPKISWAFMKVLVSWTMGQELNQPSPVHANLHGNLQVKQLGWSCLDVYLSRSPEACLYVLQHHPYLEFGLGYFNFQPTHGYDQGWTVYELKQIQTHLLSQWSTVFQQLRGQSTSVNSVLKDLEKLSLDDTWVHFFQGIQRCGDKQVLSNHVLPDVDTMDYFLHTLLMLALIGPSSIPFNLGKLLLDPVLTFVHQRPSWFSLQAETQMYLLLSTLGAFHPTLFYHHQVIPLLIEQLSFCHPNPQCQAGMRMAVTMTLWNVVHDQVVCEEQFLALGGVFRLISVLHEEQANPVIGLLLSFLSDLLEAPKTRQHVVHWQQHGLHIYHLLLNLWKQQKAELKFNKSVNAIEELNLNFCCKLFGILKKIGFDISSFLLSLEDRCLLLEIERYMDMKIGLVWEEIQYELIREGVRPTIQDDEVIKVAYNTLRFKQDLIKQLQYQIQLKESQDLQQIEQQFYKTYLEEEQKEAPISLQSSLSTFLYKKSDEPSFELKRKNSK
ncbi:hypothetical protein HMI55_000361, partial [Coelomomyces lativittatus]